EAAVMAAHESWVRGIGCSPDGRRVFTGGCDERLVAWGNAPADQSAEAPTVAWTVEPAHVGWIRGVTVSPDGATVASCGNDQLVKLWRADTGEAVAELSGHESHVYNLIFHPDGSRLFSGDLKGVVIEWDAANGKELRRLDASTIYKYDAGFRADIGGLRAIAINPGGDRLACAGVTNVTNAFAGVGNAAISLLDLSAEGKQVQLLKPKGNPNGVMWGAACHPDGFVIGAAGGGAGGYLYFFREDAAEPFHELKLPNTVRAMALHPDGLRIFVAHHDNKVRVYSMTEKPAEPENAASESGDAPKG
ncbi:MAG: hypothetical protein KDA63_19135, partial [Planctomycetales bacterium]|nr:hypothetical protein [Planctomycetales bacterium]